MNTLEIKVKDCKKGRYYYISRIRPFISGSGAVESINKRIKFIGKKRNFDKHGVDNKYSSEFGPYIFEETRLQNSKWNIGLKGDYIVTRKPIDENAHLQLHDADLEEIIKNTTWGSWFDVDYGIREVPAKNMEQLERACKSIEDNVKYIYLDIIKNGDEFNEKLFSELDEKYKEMYIKNGCETYKVFCQRVSGEPYIKVSTGGKIRYNNEVYHRIELGEDATKEEVKYKLIEFANNL